MSRIDRIGIWERVSAFFAVRTPSTPKGKLEMSLEIEWRSGIYKRYEKYGPGNLGLNIAFLDNKLDERDREIAWEYASPGMLQTILLKRVVDKLAGG